MLVINVKDGESIERALKRYKRKHSSTGVVRKLRADRYHTKPTEAKRRMNMRKKIHWPKYKWDGGHIRKMDLKDYITFFKLLFLHGSDGVKQTKHVDR